MSVKVGVRVRPYNQREKDLNCRLCVDMFGATTRLFDADDPQKHRDFTFDYSFWSHDQFHPDQNGYFVADGDKYADQQQVFQNVGLQILTNAWEGYHCCLFAYGQTGAGKSYSMVGYGTNKGIVPISCEQIFKRIANNTDKDKQYEVNLSMLEIYNEKVQDLLVPINKRLKEGYKIRQHKTLGIYVEGLSKHYVDTYQSIEAKMDQGSKNRSIAATQMNASSSRAHTIISIQFRQIEMVQGKKREKLSVIYLVDLAGSQKVGKTGATGDRLKQAAGINKSLSVLGLVISTLADKSMGKGKGIIVPYRDSCLTRILQNALGGNSKTLMICAISPATDNYEETLSTLRYADQAKKIQNKAVINQSETDKIIRNLTQEKDQLRDKVLKFEEMFKKLNLGMGIDQLQQMNDAKEQLRFNTMMMNDYSMSKKEKLQKEQQNHNEKVEQINRVDTSKPHLSNLNQDPQLSRRINYSIDQQVALTIGRRNVQPPNHIQIGGMGIRPLQAKILKNQQGKYLIEPVSDKEDTGCYLNGDQISAATELKHLDRLSFSTNNVFIVIIPGGTPSEQVEQLRIDWDYAQNQLFNKKQMIDKQKIEQKQKQIKQENQRLVRQKQQKLAQLQRKLQENQEMMKNIQQQNQLEKAQMEKRLRDQQAERLKRQIQKGKKKIKDNENQKTQKVKQKYYFEKRMHETLPQIAQLNLIAKQFKRNITMTSKILMYSSEPDQQEEDLEEKKRNIKVKVINKQAGYIYWWDAQKMSNRYYMIKDMADSYFQTGIIPQLQEKDDPFWDPPEPVFIGRAFLTTKALSYNFDNPSTQAIIGQDDQCGEIQLNMIPTDETGEKNLCEEMDQEDDFEPQYLLDNPFYFNVQVVSAKIPDNFSNIFVEYSIKKNEISTQVFKTNIINERTRNPIFNYKKLHSFDKITQNLLQYLINAKIIFKVYGCEMLATDTPKIIKSQEDKKKQVTASPDIYPTSTIPTKNAPAIVAQQTNTKKTKKDKDQKVTKVEKYDHAGPEKAKKQATKNDSAGPEKAKKQDTKVKKQDQKVKKEQGKAKKQDGKTGKKGGKDKQDCVIF